MHSALLAMYTSASFIYSGVVLGWGLRYMYMYMYILGLVCLDFYIYMYMSFSPAS